MPPIIAPPRRGKEREESGGNRDSVIMNTVESSTDHPIKKYSELVTKTTLTQPNYETTLTIFFLM